MSLLLALTWIQVPTPKAPIGIVEDNGTMYVVMTREAAQEYAIAYDKVETYKNIIELQDKMIANMKSLVSDVNAEQRRLYVITALNVLSIAAGFAFGIYLSTLEH